jgi:hypothetical protein
VREKIGRMTKEILRQRMCLLNMVGEILFLILFV